MKKKLKPLLWVKAVPEASVREIDEFGRPLKVGMCRFVGKTYDADMDDFTNIDVNGVKVPYHPIYISRIKEKALLPMDIATAQLSGVTYVPQITNKDK